MSQSDDATPLSTLETTGPRPERRHGIRTVAAVAAAALLLGGLGGAGLGWAAGGSDGSGPGGRGGFPGGVPGQVGQRLPGQQDPQGGPGRRTVPVPPGVAPSTTPDDDVAPDAPDTSTPSSST